MLNRISIRRRQRNSRRSDTLRRACRTACGYVGSSWVFGTAARPRSEACRVCGRSPVRFSGSPSAARPASCSRSPRCRGSCRPRRRGPSPEACSRPAAPAFQQDAAFGRVVGLPTGQAKNHCLAVVCRDHRAANSRSRTPLWPSGGTGR